MEIRLTNSEKEIPELTEKEYWLKVYFKLKEYEDMESDISKLGQKLTELKEYKETGILPEALKHIDNLYLEKCKEVNKLKNEVKTNADKIRNMTNEELSGFLIDVEYETQRGGLWRDKGTCLKWLESGVV